MSVEYVPLRYVTSVLARGTAPDYVGDGPIRMVSQAANQDSGLDWERTRFHDFDGDSRKLKGYLEFGDSLVNSTGTGTLGRVGWFEKSPDDRPCVADGHVTVTRFDPTRVDKRFGFYYLKSDEFQEFMFETLVNGSTNQIELSRERMSAVSMPVPPLEEQRRIADFLDAETGKIDNLVAKKRRLVALLDERIDSRVLHHVGESQLVKLDNGTPTRPIRRALTKVARSAVSDVGVITAYRDGQVTVRNSRRAEGYTLSASSEPQGQFVQFGDVVVHGLDGFAGAIGTSEADGNCSPVYHVCAPNDGNDALFMGRLLRLLALQGYLGNFATSTRERAVDFRNWDLFGRIPIPVVTYEEQCEIGESILKLRPLRAAIERSEKLATERRQALITAAVTGQFDVFAASGRGIEE